QDVLDRICCDAAIRRIVLGPEGQPLDVGRAMRTPSAAIRAAVIARDLCCTAPGCDRPATWSDIHHVTHWNRDGPTSLNNLALACRYHHGLPHHEGWEVRVGAHHRVEWLAPVWIDPTQTWRTNHIRQARDPYHHLHTAAQPP
ncbi:MAG: HNH endonuclease signature motif containing protein, partial [Frankia sp.]